MQPRFTATKEYKTLALGRNRGEYIEIAYFDGEITSFYESYGQSMSGYRSGYIGASVEETVKQLESCDWKTL